MSTTQDAINAQFEALGFTLSHTGGGCQGWELPLAHGLYLCVTDGQAALPDGRASEGVAVWVGLMSEEHGEPIAERSHATLAGGLDDLRMALVKIAPIS